MEGEGSQFPDAGEHILRLKPGSLLFSNKSMLDPNFASTVVLICHHSAEGTYGLVLNRPSHMPMSEIFNALDHHQKTTIKIFVGGPVQMGELQIIQTTQNPAMEANEILPGVFLGGHWDNLDAILREDTRNLRLFLGYSGWGAGQLEMEIHAGGWEVYNCDLHTVLSQEVDPWVKQGLEPFKQSIIDSFSLGK